MDPVPGPAMLPRWLESTSVILDHVDGDVPLEALLHLIARTTCDLGLCDFSGIFMRGDDGSALELRGSAGLNAQYLSELATNREPAFGRRARGESPTSRALRFARPVTIVDVESDPECVPYRSLFAQQGVRSMLCFPLVTPKGPVGVLNCYWKAAHGFSADLEIFLAAFANMAAMAVQTAMLHLEERATIAQLQEANRQLEHQSEALSRADVAHRMMMDAALNRTDLEDVATTLAELIGRGIVITATDGRILGSSSGADEEVGGPAAHVSAVRVTDADAATISVAPGAQPLTEFEARLIEQATIIAAILLSGQKMAQEAAWRVRRDILDDLLLTPHRLDHAQMSERARRLGIDLHRPHNLIVVRTLANDQADEELWLRRIESVVSAHNPLGIHTMVLGVAVIFHPRDAVGVSVDQLARHLGAALAELGDEVRAQIAISHDCEQVTDFSASFQAARRALDLRPESPLIDVRRLGIFRVLLTSPQPEALAAFAADILAPLKSDGDKENLLLTTLASYLRHNGFVQATAQELFVHPNTVRYRIRRAEELLGLSLEDQARRLEIELALAVSETVSADR
jgi:sugar diacid utilization regulator/GAF domain-containing protein